MQKLTTLLTVIVISSVLIMLAVITDSLRTIAANQNTSSSPELQNQMKEIGTIIARYNDNFRRIQNTFEENGYSISTSSQGLPNQ